MTTLSNEYSEQEIATIRDIFGRGLCMKANMHLLPGRGYKSVTAKAQALGIRKMPTAAAIRSVMKDGKPRTARVIAEEIGKARKAVSDFMRCAIEPGPRQEFHVCKVTEGYPTMVYVAGPGENAIPKHKQVIVEDLPDCVLDAKYRAGAKWWPQADPVVIASMHAMVNAGRAHA